MYNVLYSICDWNDTVNLLTTFFKFFYTAPPLSEFRPAMGAPLEARYTGGGGVGRGPNTHADKQAHHQPACLGRAAMGYGIPAQDFPTHNTAPTHHNQFLGPWRDGSQYVQYCKWVFVLCLG